ncbi:MAG: universal stress protein [Bacillota bacterium]
MMKNILIPVDGSEHSLFAVNIAKDLAQCSGMKMFLLNVQKKELPFHEFAQLAVLNKDRLDDYMNKLGESKLEKAKEILSGFNYEAQIKQGDPVDEILKYARDIEADVIVMGSHGTTGLISSFLGSVANKVITFSSIPVMITRDPNIPTYWSGDWIPTPDR